MAYRQIHVKIWKDSWFINLMPEQKLHYIYLFSNEMASVSGIYELPVKIQSFETGLLLEEINKNLEDFEKSRKIAFDKNINVVWVKTLRKYNANPSPKVHIRILKDLKSVPDCNVKEEYCEYYGYSIDTVSIEYINNINKTSKEKSKENEYII